MIFGDTNTCEVFISNRNFTIGYVNGHSAIWNGNGPLVKGQSFDVADNGTTFGVDYDDQYITISNEWRDRNDYKG